MVCSKYQPVSSIIFRATALLTQQQVRPKKAEQIDALGLHTSTCTVQIHLLFASASEKSEIYTLAIQTAVHTFESLFKRQNFRPHLRP